jgi:hypothetical protein
MLSPQIARDKLGNVVSLGWIAQAREEQGEQITGRRPLVHDMRGVLLISWVEEIEGDGPARPIVEATLRSPTAKKEEPDAPTSEAAQPVASLQSWRPLKAFLHLRAFEALRHREFRLLWFGQASTAMATWMDQVTRGWLTPRTRRREGARSSMSSNNETGSDSTRRRA